MLKFHYRRFFLVFCALTLVILFLNALRSPFIGKHVSSRTYTHLEKTGIPKVIYQTWKDEQIPSLYDQLPMTWKNLNSGYKHEFSTDDQNDKYVKERFPFYYPLYNRLPHDISRVDFFRYLIVYDKGGIYTDLDTECLKPIDAWSLKFPNETINAIIGIEFDASDHIVPWFSNVKMQILQWTFASAPRHPMIQHVINTIQYQYSFMSEEELSKISVHDIAGPSIWTKAILDYLCKLDFCSIKSLQWLDEPILVDDILILPPTSFQPFSDMRGKGIDHKYSFVQHKFFGSWK